MTQYNSVVSSIRRMPCPRLGNVIRTCGQAETDQWLSALVDQTVPFLGLATTSHTFFGKSLPNATSLIANGPKDRTLSPSSGGGRGQAHAPKAIAFKKDVLH